METDPVQSVLARARVTALAALSTPDVDGYLCATVLARDRPAWIVEPTKSLLAFAAPGLGRSSDVAVVGLRTALGVKPADPQALAAAVRRELTRQPLPPMRRAHDDERLMLGVAAAVCVMPELVSEMASTFSGAKRRSLRWHAVLLWAQRLARPGWDASAVSEAAHLVVSCADRALGFADAVAILGLAADLLDETGWRPDDVALTAFSRAVEAARRVVVLDAPPHLEPLDAALLLRGLAASPAQRFARRSVLDTVLATIDAFPAAVQLLADRPRDREGLPPQLEDEYDVQWLLRALLLPSVPDLVPEDPAPKLGGASSRLDFTSREARLGIEVKHLREKKHVSRMRDELMVDERQYQEHPYVETIVGFVHDPLGHIALADRFVFERDLSGPVTVAGRTVTYVVRVR